MPTPPARGRGGPPSGKRQVPGRRPAPRRPVLLPLGSSSKRIKAALLVMAIGVSVVVGRAMQLQALDSQAYAAKAAARITSSHVITPNRGEITDRNGVVLAETEPAVRVVADARMIHYNGANPDNMGPKEREKATRAPAAIADILVEYLGGSASDYLPRLTAKDPATGDFSMYSPIKRKVPAYTYTQLRKKLTEGGWYGIFKENDPIRRYPAGTVASNILGFVDGDGVGASGLEYALNDSLAGVQGREVFETSAYGKIPLGDTVLTPAVDGASYSLTLDSDLQWMAEKLVANKVIEARASTGTAVVLDVKSGEVLALANYPSFDSNSPGTADQADVGNRAVTNVYEPGSVQKVLTMAALADQGLVTPDTRVEVPQRIASGDRYVKDAFSHETIHLTARGVIANSSNIGTVMLARQSAKGALVDYLKAFGLGEVTGVGLPGEARGSVPKATMADYTRDQIAFGQGLSVTAIQEAAAVAAIANGGVYNPPRILKSATTGDGKSLPIEPAEPRRVVSTEAAGMTVDMMEAVIGADHFAKARSIPGYRMAGKSGTAERFDAATGRYSGYTASFVGLAPVEDPRILVYVVIDRPQRGSQGSELALPVVKELMQLALPRFGIAPSSTVPAYTAPLTYEP